MDKNIYLHYLLLIDIKLKDEVLYHFSYNFNSEIMGV